MFKLGKSQENSAPPAAGGAASTGNAPDLARADREAHRMLEELRGQPGFGVVMTASDAAPTGPEPTLGQRLTAELDDLARLQRHLSELRELSSRRVGDLTTEQLRRLIEFCH